MLCVTTVILAVLSVHTVFYNETFCKLSKNKKSCLKIDSLPKKFFNVFIRIAIWNPKKENKLRLYYIRNILLKNAIKILFYDNFSDFLSYFYIIIINLMSTY